MCSMDNCFTSIIWPSCMQVACQLFRRNRQSCHLCFFNQTQRLHVESLHLTSSVRKPVDVFFPQSFDMLIPCPHASGCFIFCHMDHNDDVWIFFDARSILMRVVRVMERPCVRRLSGCEGSDESWGQPLFFRDHPLKDMIQQLKPGISRGEKETVEFPNSSNTREQHRHRCSFQGAPTRRKH